MENFASLPAWIGPAVFSAALAAASYVAKLIIEWIRGILKDREARFARLVKLRSMLKASEVSFIIQNNLAKRLLGLIEKNRPIELTTGKGYEENFETFFDSFTPEEKELHGIIRSITEYSLKPMNMEMNEWLKEDTTFKAMTRRRGIYGELANGLLELETHLILWHAKYAAWIPGNPKHALVYLADEREHGIKFPSQLNGIVEKITTKI